MGQLVGVVTCFALFAACFVQLTGGTDCYVCTSRNHGGCLEDYVENVTLSTCGVPPPSPSSQSSSGSSYWRGDRDRDQEYRDRVYNAPPTTCIKEVYMFINPPIRAQNDRYNRFNRPWVDRRCGFSIQAGYRQGSDLIDECREEEVVIEGISAIRRTCSCSTDGCNLAVALRSSISVVAAVGVAVAGTHFRRFMLL